MPKSEAESKKDEKPKTKDPRANLLTSQQQKAFSQLISKEKACRSKYEQTAIDSLTPILDPSLARTSTLAAMKIQETPFNGAKVGTSLQSITLSQNSLLNSAALKKDASKEEYKQSFLYQKIMNTSPDHLQTKDIKNRHFSREQFYNQKLSRENYIAPVRSSDVYGWYQSDIDQYCRLGYGVKSLISNTNNSNLRK